MKKIFFVEGTRRISMNELKEFGAELGFTVRSCNCICESSKIEKISKALRERGFEIKVHASNF